MSDRVEIRVRSVPSKVAHRAVWVMGGYRTRCGLTILSEDAEEILMGPITRGMAEFQDCKRCGE